MLNLYTPLMSLFCALYAAIFVLFTFLLNRANYSFYQVWLVFAYLIVQSAFLGYFGEDFFIIVILSAEVPVFFAFFFFCVTKTQLGADDVSRKPAASTGVAVWLLSVFAAFLVCPLGSRDGHFHYYLVDSLITAAQRSDFFVFYFAFFIAASQFILFIGLLIGLLTLVILFFTFKNQLVSMLSLKKVKEVAWVRLQDTQIQNSQRRSFIFFRL